MADEWWRGAVIYQIYPRSFQDSTGDGVGDLPGITRRLDHVASLGVDGIWLSPFFTSPQDDMGYDVSDYGDVDPLFGTLADFDALVARAHGLGLKVVIDQVISHSSDRHPWFEESRRSRDNPKADWYVWADPQEDGSPPNNWAGIFGGPAWDWEPARRQYYFHNFLASQPDLNFHNAEVRAAMLDTMRFWLERGVDGFRLDTVNYYFHDARLRSDPPAPQAQRDRAMTIYGFQTHVHSKNQPENVPFLERMRAMTDEYDDRALMGEVGDDGDKAIELMAEYTEPGRLHMTYSFEMLGWDFTAAHFRKQIEGFRRLAPDGWPSWSFSNHDVVRHATRWAAHGESVDAVAKQAVAMLMAFEGSVGIYQGEEVGQTETELEYGELTDPQALRFWPEIKGRDGCRTPMVWEAGADHAGFSGGTPWLPVRPEQAARAVDAQEASNDSVLHAYRAAIAFRQGSEVLRLGTTRFLDLPEPLLGFVREKDGAALTCLFNLSSEAKAVTVGDAALTGPRHADLSDGVLTLPPSGHAYLDGDVPATT
ncbi:alpha-glucosidase [Jannaschia sp. Os4]|uniref:alpha-amylase family glycosyl hydrolase n=1 Tax=Jannaschia sp. Os4 TaxID=2807617 RepID=UPI00193A81BC|nr:alpha-amylase family glycosyl hydrolase [Jannaschia sp. Os4]MBM2575586.1 alpha-glucosidase [Jannaschia sp. Os4]